MEINDIATALDEMRPEDEEPSDGERVIAAKVGQIAEGELALEQSNLDEDEKDRYRRDLIGGLVIAASEYASENNLDLEDSVEERLDRMREMAEQREALEDAFDDEDDDGTPSKTFH